MVYNNIWEGNSIGINIVNADKAAERTFYCHRSIPIYKLLYLIGNLASCMTGAFYFREVYPYFTLIHSL